MGTLASLDERPLFSLSEEDTVSERVSDLPKLKQ